MTYLTTFDKRQLRDTLGTFTTGVTIVATRTADGKAHGVTANSFSSVSLDPPLVLWSQALTSKSLQAFQESDSFSVNILADDQIGISNHFAKSHEDKFNGIDHTNGHNDVPVITGSAAHVECTKIATYPGGDHVVYLGRIERIGRSHRRPLAFGGGRYMVPYAHDLGPVSLQLGSAKAPRAQDVRMAINAMKAACEAAGQHSLCLSVWGNHGPTAVYWEPSTHPVSDNLRVGLVLNVTSSAAGRVFAAYLPTAVTGRFIEEDLRLFRGPDETEESQRAALEKYIEETRQHGMSRVLEPAPALMLHQVATNGFAAPIFDAQGDIVMALSMISQAERLGSDWTGAPQRALLATAQDISRLLGVGGDRPDGDAQGIPEPRQWQGV